MFIVQCFAIIQGVFLINGMTRNESQTKNFPRSITGPCVSRTLLKIASLKIEKHRTENRIVKNWKTYHC